jgi:hypothetical protein
MFLAVLALLLVVVVVLTFAGGRLGRWTRHSQVDCRRMAAEITEAARDALVHAPGAAPARVQAGLAASLFLEMSDRLGLERSLVAAELARLGIRAEDVVPRDREEDRAPPPAVYRREGDLRDAIERALLVGIQLARMDDDYARVGDDFLDVEELVRRAEEAETELFGEERRERYVLYGKAAMVLQDMLQEETDPDRSEAIRELLGGFDERLSRLEAEMTESMAAVPEPEALQWGDSRDRRLYYFRMGVTNSLRRGGRLESLGHLYRLHGVNYDVEEAYRLAAEECSPLIQADRIELGQLLRMGPVEVRGLVERALPRSAGSG